MRGHKVGKLGEDLALQYLEKQGVRILARNYNVYGGEIDLIGFRRGVLLFVEVKTRTGTQWGTGAEAMDGEKIRHVERAAREFSKAHEEYGKIPVLYWPGIWVPRRIRHRRIDGIEVYLYPDGTPKSINRIEDIGYEIRQHPRTE
ncbi:MAG: YraN family protein [Clostridia bacterium]|nr:YraN family protein [Clostridia bacterium]